MQVSSQDFGWYMESWDLKTLLLLVSGHEARRYYPPELQHEHLDAVGLPRSEAYPRQERGQIEHYVGQEEVSKDPCEAFSGNDPWLVGIPSSETWRAMGLDQELEEFSLGASCGECR